MEGYEFLPDWLVETAGGRGQINSGNLSFNFEGPDSLISFQALARLLESLFTSGLTTVLMMVAIAPIISPLLGMLGWSSPSAPRRIMGTRGQPHSLPLCCLVRGNSGSSRVVSSRPGKEAFSDIGWSANSLSLLAGYIMILSLTRSAERGIKYGLMQNS